MTAVPVTTLLISILAIAVGFVSRDARTALGDAPWVGVWVGTLRWVVPPILAFALFYSIAGFWDAAGLYFTKFGAAP